MNSADHNQGITLHQAALIAGFGILIMAFAGTLNYFFVDTRLVIPGSIEETTQTIAANTGLFLAGISAYFTVFVVMCLLRGRSMFCSSPSIDRYHCLPDGSG